MFAINYIDQIRRRRDKRERYGTPAPLQKMYQGPKMTPMCTVNAKLEQSAHASSVLSRNAI